MRTSTRPIYDFIDTIANGFTQLNQRYADLPSALHAVLTQAANSGKTKVSLMYLPEFSQLNELMLDKWLAEETDEKGQLQLEMERNYRNGHLSYYTYVQDVFQWQYTFLRELDMDLFERYYINAKDVYDQEDELSKLGTAITQQQFKDLFITYSIMLFRWLEEQYKIMHEECYAITTAEYDLINRVTAPIEPNYGDGNQAVMDLLYRNLNGKVFELGQDEFETHFTTNTPKRRIRWRGEQSDLIGLFVGMEVIINGNQEICKLDCTNKSKAALIWQHFCRENGKTFEMESLTTRCNPNEKMKKADPGSPITVVLRELYLNHN